MVFCLTARRLENAKSSRGTPRKRRFALRTMADRTGTQTNETVSKGNSLRQTVVFYRSYGYYSELGQCWHLQIRGSIFSTSHNRIRKGLLLQLFKRVIKPENEAEVRQRFNDRARLFLQNGQKGKSVPIAIAEKAYQLPNTLANGQFETTITIPAKELASAIQTDQFGRRFIKFCSQQTDGGKTLVTGEVELIPPTGVSIVSDIDDTIKITNVKNRRELLANTFTREFRSICGMRELYQQFARDGVSFHYVSSSPWPLYVPLMSWLDLDAFPLGTLHLRHMRLRELRSDRTREAAFLSKRHAIENLLRTYPQRRFILCGDSGERDAELYGAIARDFGPQIVHIAIRNCGYEPGPLVNVTARLAHLPADRWSIFTDPTELSHLLAVSKSAQ